MKTLIVTAVLVVLTTTTFAQKETSAQSNDFVLNSEQITVAFYPNSNDAVTMILSKDEGQRVKVRVTDSNENVLYAKRYSKVNSAMVHFDVSEFPAGNYTFEVVDGNKVLYTKTITKRDNAIALAQ